MLVKEIVEVFNIGNQKEIFKIIDKINKDNPDSVICILEEVFLSVRETIRPQVCRSLGEISSDESYNALKNKLKHKSWHVRNAAAHAIANIKGKDAISDIEYLLNDKAYGVREDVGILIERLQQSAKI